MPMSNTKDLQDNKKPVTTIIRFNKKTGKISINRDHEDILLLAEKLGMENASELEAFFNSKPETVFGEKNYTSFCG